MSRQVIPLSGRAHPRRFERVPPPPRLLSARAKAVWREAAKNLHDRAILTRLDVTALKMYCWLVADAEALDAAALQAEARHAEMLTRSARQHWKDACALAADLLLPPPRRPMPQVPASDL